MSLPDPPPGGGGPAGAQLLKTSGPDAPGQEHEETLGQFVAQTTPRPARWEAVKLLRLLRLVLEGQPIQPQALPGLTYRQRAVIRAGRLSEAAIQVAMQKVVDNPEHLDRDWFGSAGINWWANPLADGTAEKAVVTGVLHYLERSLGLGESGPATNQWSWPAGTVTAGRYWWDLLTDAAVAPAAGAGFNNLRVDWHVGASATVECSISAANVLVMNTPRNSRADIARARDKQAVGGGIH